MDLAINYAVAVALGTRLVRPGPAIAQDEAAHLVADLHRASAAALGSVAEITGLDQACEAAANVPVMVIDRRGFVRANVQLAESVVNVALADQELSWLAKYGAGVQLGSALALLSARVLGQYDPFHQGPNGAKGRVLLVAPNVYRFECLVRANPRDFHLWISLHELTHAAQIAAAPWLPDWISDRLAELVAIDDQPGAIKRLTRAARQLPDLFADKTDVPPKMVGLLSPAQAYIFQEVTAVMSLLEGHADVIMDSVGPKVVRSVDQMRHRFDARRVAGGRLDRAARRLIGIEAKTAQYVQGADFVRGVLSEVGHEGLNLVWSGPDAMPTTTELDDPAAWCQRVAKAT
ncbi:MAG: zinc-dependent metalloprotease [Micrococcales bacterium]|nr:zinc-dependent metalloprotease [Micrococcales bacterium]